MSKQPKPGIVFAHGLWADGSCFQKLIPTLQADGHEVICSQHGLDSLKGDVQCVTRCFGRVSGPVVLVGHSYGGTLITHAGTNDRVAALVYIAALAPDESETSQSQQQKFPVTDVFSHIEVADGRIWQRPDGVAYFAGDLPEAMSPCYLTPRSYSMSSARPQAPFKKPEVGVQLRRPEGRDTPFAVRSASRSMAAIAFASRATCGSRSSCPDTVVPS